MTKLATGGVTALIFSFVNAAAGTLTAAPQKNYVVTLPIFTSDREGTAAVDFRTGTTSTSLQVMSQGQGDASGLQERESYPNSELLTTAQEAMVMWQSFSRPATLSGFHWGLGLGYRQTKASWSREAAQLDSAVWDSEVPYLVNYTFAGPTASARTGYRYVAPELGFSVGIYLKLRHFASSLTALRPGATLSPSQELAVAGDAESLRRRFMSRLLPVIEMGWAF